MERQTSSHGSRNHFSSSLKRLGVAAGLFVLSLATVFGHDPTEITTRIYLRTNCLEVRVTLAASTASLLMAADGHHVAALAAPADLEGARPFLKICAGELFQILAAGKPLVATETNAEWSVEDHIEIKLIYPRPAAGSLRFDAVHLGKLPADEPYGALLTVVDLANNVFLSQKLLTASDRSLEIKAAALPAGSFIPTAKPRAAIKPTPTGQELASRR